MLILNAGIVMPEWRAINGIEQHFLINCLGHFLLTHRLLDRVTAAEQGRVVVVGSGNHRDAPDGGIRFDDLSGKTNIRRHHPAPQSAYQTDAAMAKKLWDVSTELTRKYLTYIYERAARAGP
jgi:NAD(P)-dependent dehydrogenase (short-subunit alcohol dehydrogenase family)